jgi:virulence-associated protein VagC
MTYKDELTIKLQQFGIEPTDSILRFIDLETIPLKAKIFDLSAALSKAETIKPVEDVAYMLDKMDKFQLEDTDYDYSNVNDEISKAEDKGEGVVKLYSESALKKMWDKGVQRGDANCEFGGDTLLPDYNEVLLTIKPYTQPTNSLDELERWVGEQPLMIHTNNLLAKIQELKTITT